MRRQRIVALDAVDHAEQRIGRGLLMAQNEGVDAFVQAGAVIVAHGGVGADPHLPALQHESPHPAVPRTLGLKDAVQFTLAVVQHERHDRARLVADPVVFARGELQIGADPAQLLKRLGAHGKVARRRVPGWMRPAQGSKPGEPLRRRTMATLAMLTAIVNGIPVR